MRAAPALGRALSLAGEALLDFALPRCCVSCDAPLRSSERELVCGVCWSRLPSLPHPRCDRCGHPTRGRPCRWCALLPPYVRAARSVCWVPEGTGGAIVHALKYDGWYGLADAMAERMARLHWPEDVVAERSALVPVPLSAVRERERGYNQSMLLARALACRWGIPVGATWLRRGRGTTSQTRLTPSDRRRNVFGAFHATAPADRALAGAHLILVDDVVTTGSTLNACAGALFAAGARILSYVTFGRAPASGDR